MQKFRESDDLLKREYENRIKENIVPLLSSAKRTRNITPAMIEHIENTLSSLFLGETTPSTTVKNKLTFTEVSTAKMVQKGCQAKEIAKELGIALSTVHNHLANVRKKLGIKNAKVNLRSYLKDISL